MIWPQSNDSVDLLTQDEKLEGMEVLAKTTQGLSTTALCLGVQGKDTDDMLVYAKHAKKLSPTAIISRPPDTGKTQDDLRQYWRALASVITEQPVMIQTTARRGGTSPSTELLIELAKEFPNFGYVKEESNPVVPRIRALLASPSIRSVFSASGRLWMALRVAARHRRPRHRTNRLRRHPRKDLETDEKRLRSRDAQGHVQQADADVQPVANAPRQPARLQSLFVEDAWRVPHDDLASVWSGWQHSRQADLFGTDALGRGDRRNRVAFRVAQAVPEARQVRGPVSSRPSKIETRLADLGQCMLRDDREELAFHMEVPFA